MMHCMNVQGGGVTVLEMWATGGSFEEFLQEMGKGRSARVGFACHDV